MDDEGLREWEHQPNVIRVLTTKEMGDWLHRRDKRLLQEIRQRIMSKDGLEEALEIIDEYIS